MSKSCRQNGKQCRHWYGPAPYMPYLTLWGKVSQNLAHLDANSNKIFQISQIFQTIFQHILRRNKHKSHFVVFITSFLYLNKGFWIFWGSSNLIFVEMSQNFIKSPLKICLISQISAHIVWHECPDLSVWKHKILTVHQMKAGSFPVDWYQTLWYIMQGCMETLQSNTAHSWHLTVFLQLT